MPSTYQPNVAREAGPYRIPTTTIPQARPSPTVLRHISFRPVHCGLDKVFTGPCFQQVLRRAASKKGCLMMAQSRRLGPDKRGGYGFGPTLTCFVYSFPRDPDTGGKIITAASLSLSKKKKDNNRRGINEIHRKIIWVHKFFFEKMKLWTDDGPGRHPIRQISKDTKHHLQRRTPDMSPLKC